MLKFNTNIRKFEDCLSVIEKRFEKRKEDGYMYIHTGDLDDFTSKRLIKHLKNEGFKVNTDYHEGFMLRWFSDKTKNNFK